MASRRLPARRLLLLAAVSVLVLAAHAGGEASSPGLLQVTDAHGTAGSNLVV